MLITPADHYKAKKKKTKNELTKEGIIKNKERKKKFNKEVNNPSRGKK